MAHMKLVLTILLFTGSLLLQGQALAWDAIGHRLSAALALTRLDDATSQELFALLAQHPRYQEDFLDAMPAFVRRGNTREQQQWLLGQAAFWPDIARGLPETAAAQFNHPGWHYLDGAWVRDAATRQGNVYVNTGPFPDIVGEAPATIRAVSQVSNVMTALDYNTRVLADATQATADRAVALCWVLHLMGDIHQPLHAGSLYSARLFRTGDRGGNRIPTDAHDLHSRWDGAVSDRGVQELLDEAQRLAEALPETDISIQDWSVWLAESREHLQAGVYTPQMKAAIAAADRSGDDLSIQVLPPGYVAAMRTTGLNRLTLAGLRTARWLSANL